MLHHLWWPYLTITFGDPSLFSLTKEIKDSTPCLYFCPIRGRSRGRIDKGRVDKAADNIYRKICSEVYFNTTNKLIILVASPIYYKGYLFLPF